MAGGRACFAHLPPPAPTATEIKQQLKDQTKAAVKRGVFGVPSMFTGNEMFFGKNSMGNLGLELSKTP